MRSSGGFRCFIRICCKWQEGLVRPGITGIWQISARDQNTSALDMAEHDLRYVRENSLWLDFRILLRTMQHVLSRGAH